MGGILCLYFGYALFVKGVSGKASLKVEYDKSKLQLANAAPGIIFALFGACILVFSLWKAPTIDYVVHMPVSQGKMSTLPASADGAVDYPPLVHADEEIQKITDLLRKNGFDIKVVDKTPEAYGDTKGVYVVLHFVTHGTAAETNASSKINKEAK